MILPDDADEQQRHVSRQAYAGLMWSKQFYHYIVADWLSGDRDVATPPAESLWRSQPRVATFVRSRRPVDAR